MEDLSTPAPSGSTESAAPQVTATEQSHTPQAQQPAGTPQAEAPAGQDATDPASGDESQSQDNEQHKSWKEKRQERNRERWRAYREAQTVLPKRLEALEDEVRRLRSQQPPDLSQVVDPDEVIAEKAAWKIRQHQTHEAEQRLQSEKERASRERAEHIYDAWAEVVEDMRSRVPDFEAVVNAQTPIHHRMADVLIESENAGEIAYYLGKNPKVAQELFRKFETAPKQALVEFGELKAKATASTSKPVSTAPKPAPVLNGGGNPAPFDMARASVDDVAQQLKKLGLIR